MDEVIVFISLALVAILIISFIVLFIADRSNPNA